jgi:SAM-dependent methyltransferase
LTAGGCVACGGGSRRIGPNPDYAGSDVVRCRKCGLVWTRPLPSATDRSDDYDGRYALHHATDLPPHYLPHKDARAAAQHRFVLDHTGIGASASVSVLDIGCGVGSLLRAFAADANVTDLVGIEPSSVMRARAARRLPERAVLLGGLFTPEAVAGRRFTLAVGSHVLEHVPDPVSFLVDLRSCVEPGGVAFFEVPHESAATIGDVVRARWAGLMHVIFFTAPTLADVFRRAGWEPLRVAAVGPPLPTFSVVPEANRHWRQRWRERLGSGATRAARGDAAAMGTVEAFDLGEDPDGAWLRIVARNPGPGGP